MWGVAANPGPIADKADDVITNLLDAQLKLELGDNPGAEGALQGAQNEVQAMINDSMLTQVVGDMKIADLADIIDELQ